jgi:two-component system phosphate regulon response regulator PhoB
MSGRLVLLADDETHITSVVAQKLRSAGLDVIVAEDGEEALEMARERTPDLIVTDLQMPYLSGIELATELKADAKTGHIPLIMLTARGYVLSPDEVASTNIRELMSKPFSARELLDKVLSLLDAQATIQRDAA